jgi:hypothetical protein
MITSTYLQTEKDVYNSILTSLYSRLERNKQAIDRINKLNHTKIKYNDEETLDTIECDMEMYEEESEALRLAIIRIGYLADYKKMAKKLKH